MVFQNINIFSRNFIINLLMPIIPLSYIAGNMVLNMNVIIIILLTFLFYGKDVLSQKLSQIDKIILFLFTYIFFNGLMNNFLNFNFTDIAAENLVLKKTLLYLRLFLFYFVLRYLIKKEIINYKFLFFSFGFFVLFVSLDILIQFIFGRDIFGYEGSGRRLSGPFGGEYVAGSFLQRYSLFAIFSFIIFLNFKKKIIFELSVFFLILIITLSIVLAGNRVPLVMFILMLCASFLFQKELRRIFLFLIVVIAFFLSHLSTTSESYHAHYAGFKQKGFQILYYLKDKITGQEIIIPEIAQRNSYIKELETGFATSKSNLAFGGGVRSFYWNCSKIDTKLLTEINKLGGCNSHPHNYYLEIVSNLGLFGLFLISLLFLRIIYQFFKFLFLSKSNSKKNLAIPLFIIFLAEIFPLKTSGSFFTTTNSVFLFFVIAFIVSLTEYKTDLKNI